MMLAWVLDLLLISGLLGLSALLLEQILRAHHRATRISWLVAMVATLLLPLLASWQGPHTATAPGATGAALDAYARADHPRSYASWIELGAASSGVTDHRRRERLIVWLWASSAAMAGLIVMGGVVQFRRQRRTWRRGMVAGVPVWIAPEAGPAVFGVFRPQIVVPEWLLKASLDTQRCVMAHERAHVHAGDSRVLTLSTILVLLVPWNPLLWWHAHRLRLAIEVDCDRRVLRSGFDVQRYAEVLIQFGLRRASLLGATASISESPSILERRITLMFQPKNPRRTLASVALALLSIGSVAAATRIAPPPLRLAAATAMSEARPTDIYVGSYEFASMTVLSIRRERDQLSAAFPEQSADQLSPLKPDEYRYKDADVTIRFMRDMAGQITGLNFEQNGAVTYAPRIASTRVQAIQGEIAERYRQQLATPGSEQALRALIAGLQSGSPDYSLMSAQLAGGTRTLLKSFQDTMQPFGSIQAIEFTGVNKTGWDQYQVKHAHGTAEWKISLDDKGVIVGALVNFDS